MDGLSLQVTGQWKIWLLVRVNVRGVSTRAMQRCWKQGLRCPAALPSPVYPARNCVVCSGGHAKSPGDLLMNPGIVETHQSVSVLHWSLWNQKNNCAKWKQQKMDIK